MSKYEKYIKNRRKKNKSFLILALVVFAISFFLLKNFNQSLEANIKVTNEDIKKAKSDIGLVKKDIETIKKDYENRNTDDFKEKVARERLGMVKKHELIYKDNNNN